MKCQRIGLIAEIDGNEGSNSSLLVCDIQCWLVFVCAPIRIAVRDSPFFYISVQGVFE